MQTNIMVRFGQAVRIIRHDQGISQEELAERCGLHRTYISDVELGKRNVIPLRTTSISSLKERAKLNGAALQKMPCEKTVNLLPGFVVVLVLIEHLL